LLRIFRYFIVDTLGVFKIGSFRNKQVKRCGFGGDDGDNAAQYC
jgi:hypothetical protein